MKALEVTGRVDEQGHVQLDHPLPLINAKSSRRVRAILLFPEFDENGAEEWSQWVIQSSAFDSINDPEEDIYTLEDGKPIDHEG